MASNAAAVTLAKPLICNDTHSQLNMTSMLGTIEPRSVADVCSAVQKVSKRGDHIAIAGGRHAMGGQQFATKAWLLDMRGMDQVLSFDREGGLLKTEAGIMWPDLIRHYVVAQAGAKRQWGIGQKQTGADRLTLGGAVAANIHGRGLSMQPFIQDIEALDIVLADGSEVTCSRTQRSDLFRHVVGGYGLFGVVTAVTLRLRERQKVQRVVEINHINEIMDTFDQRKRDGYLYGDFQFSTDPKDPDFLGRGVFSCYRPVESIVEMTKNPIRLTPDKWRRLLYLAHKDKNRAFEEFADFYLRSSGQIYWSDTHQLSLYLDDYHGELDRAMGATTRGSEAITELYVPPEQLPAFMQAVRKDFLQNDVDLIYGTVRLIEADCETALPWAKESYACIIFNLHIDHCESSIETSAGHFRRLIDLAIAHGGSYFLTYHRHASIDQVLGCYPELPAFLEQKLIYDPDELFQSDWYRHYRQLLAL